MTTTDYSAIARAQIQELEQAVKESAPAPTLTHIRDLLREPDEVVTWIVDGLLPAAGLGVIAGKPKAGKSTTARAIALRVSRGEPVLGRTTTKGPAIYLGLEDPKRVTKRHLQQLGARESDDLYVWSGVRPDEAMLWLKGILETVDPVLVVADTLQYLLGVSDLNDYARVVSAFRPVLELIRPRRAHMLFTHHAGKGERVGFDAILGSTAILGSVDTALLVRRRDDNTRTIMSMQRTGEDMPESVVTLDQSGEPHIEGTRAEYDAKQMDAQIIAWLTTQVEPVTRDTVKENVEGRAEVVVAALQRLHASGQLTRTGGGKRGDPYLFAFPFRRSHIEEGTERRNPEMGGPSRNAATISVPETRSPSDVPSASGNGKVGCPKGHPMVAGICPTCDQARFLAALDAEASQATGAAA